MAHWESQWGFRGPLGRFRGFKRWLREMLESFQGSSRKFRGAQGLSGASHRVSGVLQRSKGRFKWSAEIPSKFQRVSGVFRGTSRTQYLKKLTRDFRIISKGSQGVLKGTRRRFKGS